MVWFSSTRRAEIIARITVLDSQIAKLNDAIDSSLDRGGRIDYTLETAEGKQRTKYEDIESLLSSIERLTAMRDMWWRKLNGLGIKSMNLRRKPLS